MGKGLAWKGVLVLEICGLRGFGTNVNGKPIRCSNALEGHHILSKSKYRGAKAVKKYVAAKQADLPAGITVEVLSDLSKFIEDRLDMLIRNGLWGLSLVFLVLLVFLGVNLYSVAAAGPLMISMLSMLDGSMSSSRDVAGSPNPPLILLFSSGHRYHEAPFRQHLPGRGRLLLHL